MNPHKIISCFWIAIEIQVMYNFEFLVEYIFQSVCNKYIAFGWPTRPVLFPPLGIRSAKKNFSMQFDTAKLLSL